MIKKHWKILLTITVLIIAVVFGYFYYYQFIPKGEEN
jgi:uncharacterized protein YpmB